MRFLLGFFLCALALACRSPLADLEPGPQGFALRLDPVRVEDHSRQLKRLRAVGPSEANAPEARRAALDAYGAWMEEAFRFEAGRCGLAFAPDAPYRMELAITNLGEVRAKYIVYGIASGVGWGVGTGLVAHNPALALGLGGYELVEESAFWIGGSSVFGSFSAPAVVEARLFRAGEAKPLWGETYYSLSGRAWTRGLPEGQRRDRGVQVRASLQNVIGKILEDLEAVPGVPKGVKARLRSPELAEALRSRILHA